MCRWRVTWLSRCVLAVQLLVADELAYLRVHVGTPVDMPSPPDLVVGSSNLRPCAGNQHCNT